MITSTPGTDENEKKDSETASCCKTLVTHLRCQRSTCENDVGYVAMVTVALLLLLLLWQAAVATAQAHHERLGVVEGGGLVVQAVGADGCFHHVELLQLSIATEEDNCCCGNKHCIAPTGTGLLSHLL